MPVDDQMNSENIDKMFGKKSEYSGKKIIGGSVIVPAGGKPVYTYRLEDGTEETVCDGKTFDIKKLKYAKRGEKV